MDKLKKWAEQHPALVTIVIGVVTLGLTLYIYNANKANSSSTVPTGNASVPDQNLSAPLPPSQDGGNNNDTLLASMNSLLQAILALVGKNGTGASPPPNNPPPVNPPPHQPPPINPRPMPGPFGGPGMGIGGITGGPFPTAGQTFPGDWGIIYDGMINTTINQYSGYSGPVPLPNGLPPQDQPPVRGRIFSRLIGVRNSSLSSSKSYLQNSYYNSGNGLMVSRISIPD